MWDLVKISLTDRKPIRRIFMCFIAIIMASFVTLSLTFTPVMAADAKWENGAIVYNGNSYNQISDATAGDPRGFAEGSKIYEYTENSGEPNQIKHYLTFAPNSNPNDTTSVNYSSFHNPPPGTSYSKDVAARSITIDKAPAGSTNEALDAGGTTSCDARFTLGIGWIVCPVTKFLAHAMDWLFDQMARFLVVRTVTSSVDSPQYRIWEVMRNLANIAFVIAFLMIIYSQITSLGISNYGMKRMLPRVIVAAILVNVSYWICAIAVDLSNAAGYAVHDMFIALRESIVQGGNSWQLVSWESIVGVVLSGGAGAAALGIYAHVIAAQSVGGSLFLLIPILLGVILAVLIALLILAARQALIIIFIIISPLAFVAYILPSTEKWFDKWRTTFGTLLLLFPVFAVIFGGSQLAGIAIIQTATDINMLILGMAVQVAPVVITPLLVKFSGSLLARIANIVNDPKRGMLDRTRNWSQERAAEHKAKILGGHVARTPFGRFTSNRTRTIDHKRRRREALRKYHEKLADEAYENSESGKAIDLKMRVVLDKESLRKAKADAHYEEMRAGRSTSGFYGDLTSPAASQYAERRRANTLSQLGDLNRMSDEIAVNGLRKKQATEELQSDFNSRLLKHTATVDGVDILDYAAGIGERDVVLADVVARDRKEFGELASAQKELMNHFKVNAGEVERLAMGEGDVIKFDSNGNTHRFKSSNVYTHDAAAEEIFTVGSHGQKLKVIMSTGADFDASGNVIAGSEGINYEYRRTVQQAAIKSGISSVAPAIADKTLDDIINGKFKGIESWQYHSFREILEGRVKMNSLATANAESLKLLFADVDSSPNARAQFDRLIDSTVTTELKSRSIDDTSANRATVRNEVISKFDTERAGVRQMAAQVLSNTTVRQSANSQSVDVLKDFAGTLYKGK